MKGTANMKDVKEQGTFTELPAGEYLAEIVEIKEGWTKNNDAMPSIKLQIITPEFKDCWLWDNIIISDNPSSAGYKILGRSKHFLHCIGQPYEGEQVEFDTDAWQWKQVRIKTDVEKPNEFHKYPKPIVAYYILDEELTKGVVPSEITPSDKTEEAPW